MAGIAWRRPHGRAARRSKPSSLTAIPSRIMLVWDRTSCPIEAGRLREEHPAPLRSPFLDPEVTPKASSVGRVPIERLARREQSLTARIGDRDQGTEDRRVEAARDEA